MCTPAIAAALPSIMGVSAATYIPLAAGAGMAYAGARSNASARDRASASAINQKTQGIMRQTQANLRGSQATAAANDEQARLSDERMNLFNKGVKNVASTKDVNQNIGKETGKLSSVLKASIARGEQQAGSGVQGNVSKSFSDAQTKTVAKSGGDAQRLASQLGVIGGTRRIPNSQRVGLGNMNAGLASISSRAKGQQALDRLRINIARMVQPEGINIVDPSSATGDLMRAVGGGLMTYSLGGAFNQKPKLLGPAGTGNPYGPGSGMAASDSVWRT